ncbi:MAG TPA: dihydrofolate reductase family protein [Solirubrobacterales bacterium]|jgi:dihydrofolate reductase|nr:dihydrofolate reductase family protein [Solirubrobacterales bacterium]
MPRLRCQIAISLDGYVAGPNQGEEHPLGEGGEQLHEWIVNLAAWRASHGREGGEVNASTPVVEAATRNLGAVLMGRNMFGPVRGPWGEDPWQGWWGEEPPFHLPVFVLTHHARPPLTLGDTTFHFVTEGLETAVQRAREAAGDRDVSVGGGGETVRQCIAAGLLDELTLNVVPILLGGGARLFDGLGPEVSLEQVRAVEAPGVTHLTYRL